MNVTYVTDQDDRTLALVAADIGIAIVPEGYSHPGIVTCPLKEVQDHRVVGFEWGSSESEEEITGFVEFASTARWT